MIKATNINFFFNSSVQKLEVLKDLSFEINEKELVSIIGPSGCGKTTLLKLLGGLYDNSSKDVTIQGSVNVLNMLPLEARKKQQIGFVFQNPTLLPWRKVIDNVKLPLEIIGDSKKRDFWDPNDLLKLVGLYDFKNAFPRELSGGMQQRVAIARALVFKPSILLMDEPFGSLDERTRERLNLDLLRIKNSIGATILFVTHNLYEAVFLSNKILILSNRPAYVKDTIEVNFDSRSMDIKETNKFIEYAKYLRKNLEGNN
jgi:NitT/TauT family transport system ATP-binding protein